MAPVMFGEIRIAVNSAIDHLPNHWANWFCAGDACTYRRVVNRPRIGYCALNGFVAEIDELGHPWSVLEVIEWEELPLIMRMPELPNWSIVAALALAARLGATAIELYGHDQTNTSDCIGSNAGERTDERWGRERIDFDMMSELLRAYQITLTIHHPPRILP